jgi:hypothetical protein
MHGHAYRVAAQGAGRSADRSSQRHFIGALAATVAALCTGGLPRPLRARAPSGRLHLQDSRIAGSHYYDCHAVLDRLRPGDSLQLRRQPDNPHDPRAIEVFWRRHKLGYVSRLDNSAAASLLDRAHTLHAEIIGIDDPHEKWEPLRLRLWVTSA